MTAFLQNLRFAFRLFSRQPGFAFVAILILGVGIGANTTMFSLVNELILKPRPGAGEELVQVYSKHRTEPDSFRSFSYDNFSDLRARTDVFASLTAHNAGMVGITDGDTTRRAFIDITTGDIFNTFDVPLAMGRSFTLEEEKPGADVPVTILSYNLWERMGARADAVGGIIRINQRDFTVVGVAPEGFSGTTVMVTPELWLPTGVYDSVVNDFSSDTLTGTLKDRRHHTLIVYGRLRDGLSIEAASTGLETISHAMEAAFPAENQAQQLVIQPASRLSISTSPTSEGPVAVVGASLLAMSGIVLLIAALNLANMQLARGSARAKEFAIRMSIGGSRAQVVRQLMTESLLLSLAGGALALLVAMGAMRALVSGMNGLLPVMLTIETTPDARIFVATLAFAMIGTVISSLGPALAASRADVLPALKEQAGELPLRGRSRFQVRHVLVMGQLALSLALLTTAGAFIRGAWVAADVDPGFSFERGIHAGLDTSLAGFDRPRAMAVYNDVLDRVRRVPAVTHVSLSSLMPFGDVSEGSSIQQPGAVRRPSDPDYDTAVTSAITQSVTQDYFPSLGLQLLRGRDFSLAEITTADTPPVAIIDEALATRVFGTDDPLGRQIQINRGRDVAPELAMVIGIAPPIKHQMNDDAAGAHVYRPHAQRFRSGMTLHVRTVADDEAVVLPAIRAVLREADPMLPVITLETGAMFRERSAMLWIVRTGARIFTIFGVVALVMASLGIYGVKAFLVSRRTREIGIRLALGAQARDVAALVLRDGLFTTIAGLVLGLGLSFVAVQGIGSLLFDGGGFDLPIVAAAFVALVVSALVANWVPARRAMRVAPTVALRNG
jgi:predicted permease